MTAANWLNAAIDVKTTSNSENVPTVPTNGNSASSKWEQLKPLSVAGFSGCVPTVPTVPTKTQSPRENREKQGELIPESNISSLTTRSMIPSDLLERVNLICRIESWFEADRLEWIIILQCQIDNDKTPSAELVDTLDAHLDRWHPEWRMRYAA